MPHFNNNTYSPQQHIHIQIMYNYMDYLTKCFYRSTSWNEDNIYENITATSQNLLEFHIPNGAKLDVSSKSSNHTATSLSLSNFGAINGSIAYLYTSAPLSNALGSKIISLQDAIAGFRVIQPHVDQLNESNAKNFSLLYGRMYFPGSALEAMLIKKLSPYSQLLIKCVSNENLKNNGTMTFYLQQDMGRYSREYIFSTNEALLGFRCLYNLGASPNLMNSYGNKNKMFPKFDNSIISMGLEVWYGCLNMSPGLSTAIRYHTQSTLTGKPLTMTLAANPILGHISSTYTVKTSVSSTFSSRYDFNIYSYASNLSLGFELYNYSKNNNHIMNNNDDIDVTLSPHQRRDHNQSVITAFQNLINESNFSNVLKMSTSLNDKLINVLWIGKFKDFLISLGAKVSLQKNVPEFTKVGISFQYSS